MNEPDVNKDRKIHAPSESGEASRSAEREKLIRGLEAEWKLKEREAGRAVRDATKPHGWLGKLGFNTSTG